MDPFGLEAITMGAMGGGAVAGPPGALVGAALGGLVLLTVGVVAWMLSSTTTDKAGNKVSPIADTMQPPGTCSPGEHRRLQDEVDRACKGEKRSCRANMDNATILMMRQRNVRCAIARDLMNGKCFAGGDAIHRNEAIKAWESVAKCDGLLK